MGGGIGPDDIGMSMSGLTSTSTLWLTPRRNNMIAAFGITLAFRISTRMPRSL